MIACVVFARSTNLRSLPIKIAGFLCSAVPIAAMLVVWWSFRAIQERRLFPPQRHRAIPWENREVLGWIMLALAFLLIYLFLPVMVYSVFRATGFYSLPYGPETASEQAKEESAQPEGEEQEDNLQRTLRALWASLFAFPFQAAGLLLLVWLTSGVRPFQVGLTPHYLPRNLALGALGWILLTLPVYFLNAVVVYVNQFVFQVSQEAHPLTRLLSEVPATRDIVVIVLTAVVAAPVLEELFFRGLLQPWFGRSHKSSLVGLGIAFVLALEQREGKIVAGWQNAGWLGAAQEAQALFFVAAMVPGYFLTRRVTGWVMQLWLSRRNTAGMPMHPRSVGRRTNCAVRAAGGIYSASLLFAAAHSFAWPEPVSLFVLALGLGFLRYRTQSLTGPILLHALFNGVACVALLAYPHLVPSDEKGNETTSAVRAAPAVPSCTTDPGCELPRRMYPSAIGPNLGDTTADVICPTSLPSRKSIVPRAGTSPADKRNPIKVRLTCPRSRAMTIGS
jgi:membrane protease YdiL (CAAX protease family)